MPRRQSWTLARSLDQGPSAGPCRRWGKRAFDLSAASVGLLVLSPILLLCAVLVRLTSRGPVFFRQKRLTLHGRTFTVLKLPTMRVRR
jgi:lipopolysaccharide/colanic/teichoic acid biosynthesis glycosyltransferase